MSQALMKIPNKDREYNFKPGQVNNPHGRPPATPQYLKDLCRSHTDEIINTLMQCVRDENERWPVRQSAMQMVMDRGYGKVANVIEQGEGERGVGATITMLSTDSIKQMLVNSSQQHNQAEPTQPQPTQAVIADT